MSWIKLAFSVVLLALAALHRWMNFDALSVGLGVTAMAPWILPELQSLFQSVKVGSVFEATFRDLQAKVAAQQVALEGGVGGKTEPDATSPFAGLPPGPLKPASFAAPAAAEGPPIDPADPNKHQFGSSPSGDGLRLDAQVNPFPGSHRLFRIHAWVSAESGPPMEKGTKVRFYLHPTFRRPFLDVVAGSDGRAAIDLVAWGAFTMGAIAVQAGHEVRLELDLAQDVPDAPAAFKSR